MLTLTSENVEKIFLDCLFKDGEDTTNYVPAEGIVVNVGFHPERLASHREEVKELLSQLPTDFLTGEGNGGGTTFLHACNTAEGVQWGEHKNMEQLFLLGLASKFAKECLPRTLRTVLPGGMPYYAVNLEGWPTDVPAPTAS